MPHDPGLTCANCDFGEHRHEHGPEAIARAHRAGYPLGEIRCLQSPTPIPKRSTEFCAQHSILQDRRDAALAELIAAALEGVLSGGKNRRAS